MCRCGCKQLIRKRARCLLTGRDSGGGAPPETRGCNCVSPASSCLSFPSLYLRIGSEPRSNSPCCMSAFILLHPLIPLPLARWAASSCVPDPLINNRGALPHRFLLLSVVFHFEADVRQSLHFRRAPSLRRRDSLTFLPFLSTYGNSPSRSPRDSSLASPSNTETPRPSSFPVLTGDLRILDGVDGWEIARSLRSREKRREKSNVPLERQLLVSELFRNPRNPNFKRLSAPSQPGGVGNGS